MPPENAALENISTDKAYIEDIVAIIPVRDVERSVEFYVQILGFEPRFIAEEKNFATVIYKNTQNAESKERAIHFIQTEDENALKATAQNISLYLWTKNIDQLYNKLEAKLSVLPQERKRAPFDQPYGMREFHLKDPDGCLLMFGENNAT